MKSKLTEFLISKDFLIKQAMKRLSDLGEKDLFIVDGKQRLLGSLSDGDIRKWILKEGSMDASVETVFNRSPRSVGKEYRLEDVKETMLQLKIECIPVVDKNQKVVDMLVWDEVFAGKVDRHRQQLDVAVVIMAGGKGSRLDPFTKILPKALIPIGEKPIIELIMEKFMAHAVKDFYIAVYHKSRMIKSYFEEANQKLKINYLEETEPLGTVGGLHLLKDRVQGPFIVTNCDVIINTDYAELVNFHRDNGHDLTIVVSMRHYQIPYGVCELESGGLLKLIKEKPEYDLLINTGMYVMNPEVLKHIPSDRPSSIIDLIDMVKLNGGKIGVFPISEKSWVDVGQWEEYHKSIKDLQELK